MIKEQKSMLSPVQQIEFIRAVLDSTHARAFPEPLFQAISDLIRHIQAFPLTMARTFLRLLGHRATYMYVVHHARLRLRPLQS